MLLNLTLTTKIIISNPIWWNQNTSYSTAIKLMAAAPQTSSQRETDYSSWSNSRLISRIAELERQLDSHTGRYLSPTEDPSSPKSPTEKDLAPASGDFTRIRPRHSSPARLREIDPSKYNTRFIVLKFAYLGQRYNGYEHANGNVTPLATIEEELWKALRKSRLIFPKNVGNTDNLDDGDRRSLRPYTINWEGCQYSKCGRTDRGVSAFGQVIGIRVRSSRPKPSTKCKGPSATLENDKLLCSARPDESLRDDPLTGFDVSDLGESEGETWDDIADELPYLQILNSVLPDDIRVLAWCPRPPSDFDARFSCRERRYRYFFTQPAFSPTPGPLGLLKGVGNETGVRSKSNFREGWLDIDAMREGAKRFVGVHDFRNFCKVDTSKQMTNFVRNIFHADIELVNTKTCLPAYLGTSDFRPLETNGIEQISESPRNYSPFAPQIYTFTVHGNAFLWHQVRHMAAILFLIGQGLEAPSIISELLDVTTNPRKPTYEIASDAPLVLWDCIFPDEAGDSREDALEWIYSGDPRTLNSRSGKGDGKFGLGGTVENIWTVWRRRKIDEILAGNLLNLSVSRGNKSALDRGGFKSSTVDMLPRSQKVFYGGNGAKMGGKYVPVMRKQKMDTVEVLNAKYLSNRQRRAIQDEDDEVENSRPDGCP
jgi:tRNA pseudouridine38/39 synthase